MFNYAVVNRKRETRGAGLIFVTSTGIKNYVGISVLMMLFNFYFHGFVVSLAFWLVALFEERSNKSLKTVGALKRAP
jgi:hypothetical protein